MDRNIIFLCLVIYIFTIDSVNSKKRRFHGKKNENKKILRVSGEENDVNRINNGDNEEMNGEENCWLQVDIKNHFKKMEALEAKHKKVRKDFQKAIDERNLNKEMLDMMLQTRGAAERAIHNFGGKPWKIPAGINLGGYGMMKLDDTMLFFHRMKLRNDTRFRLHFVHADVFNMVLTARLSLNDLRLFGQYERALSDKDALFYRPSFGELELLLKDVTYKMEGRLRLVQSRLVVEHVISEMRIANLFLMYHNNNATGDCGKTERLAPAAISDFLERLKADLDSWLKDYFNDYLLYFELSDAAANKELHCYDKQKQVNLNDYMDHVIEQMHQKLYSMKPSAANVKTPGFSIFSVNGVQIRLHSGVIRGMDSFHRQSVASGRLEKQLRKIDAVIGFSKLKMEYKYLAKISGKTPPLMGLFVLTADDLIAHLGLSLLKEPEAMEINIGFLRQVRSQTLVIEGAVNRMVGNFKHVLENEIIALMSNALLFHIKQLTSLTRCEPVLQGHLDEGEISQKGGNNGRGKGLKEPSYGVERNDSIELEIPGTNKNPPKKVHITHLQKFRVDESLLPEQQQKLADILEYGIIRNDSIELEVPGTDDNPPKKLHINYGQHFDLHEGDKKNKPPKTVKDGNYDEQGKGQGSEYGVQRNDSIELEFPGTGNSPPNKVHVNYEHHFDLHKKGNNKDKHPELSRDDNTDANGLSKDEQPELNKDSDYGVLRNDSIELELSATDNSPPKKMHLNYDHYFNLHRNKKKVKQIKKSNKNYEMKQLRDGVKREDELSKDSEYGVHRSDGIEFELPANGNVKNKANQPERLREGKRNVLEPSEGSEYGVQRNDSIELELPGTDNNPPETVHVNYGQKFNLRGNIKNKANQPERPNQNDDVKASGRPNNEANGRIWKGAGYGVQRNDSIEIELPGTDNKSPETVHINYGHQLKLHGNNEAKQTQQPEESSSDKNSPLSSTAISTNFSENNYQDDDDDDIIRESGRR